MILIVKLNHIQHSKAWAIQEVSGVLWWQFNGKSNQRTKARRWEGTLLILLLTNKDRLVRVVKLCHPDCRSCEKGEFGILRRGGCGITSQDFRRRDFGLLRDPLPGKILWETVIMLVQNTHFPLLYVQVLFSLTLSIIKMREKKNQISLLNCFN